MILEDDLYPNYLQDGIYDMLWADYRLKEHILITENGMEYVH